MKLNNEELGIVRYLLLTAGDNLTRHSGPFFSNDKENPKYSKTFIKFIQKIHNWHKMIKKKDIKLDEMIMSKEFNADIDAYWECKTKLHPNINAEKYGKEFTIDQPIIKRRKYASKTT